MHKEALSAVGILLTFIAFIPYVVSIIRGYTRPHVFSWVIWGSTTFVVFLAQVQSKGGAGAWPIGVSGAITILVAVLAYSKKADCSIKSMDWLFFMLAMTSLPFWYLTADPFWAVLILTTVDILGFGPTIRKAYYFPFDEQIVFYAFFVARNSVAVMALENYSATTVLFPAATGLACLLLITVIGFRRRVLSAIKRT